MNRLGRGIGLVALLVLLLAGGAFAATALSAQEKVPAKAASGKPLCATCSKPIEGMPVTLRADKESTYRCINCALIGSERHGECTIAAYSALNGKQVSLQKKAGHWSAVPESAVALSLPEEKGECLGRHLVFSSGEEFRAYLASHPAIAAQRPKAIPLLQVKAILQAGRPPLPGEAVCPVTKRVFKVSRETAWTVKEGKTYYFCCPGCRAEFYKQ